MHLKAVGRKKSGDRLSRREWPLTAAAPWSSRPDDVATEVLDNLIDKLGSIHLAACCVSLYLNLVAFM